MPLRTETIPGTLPIFAATAARQRRKLRRVRREQLDLDRLWDGGEVADEVLHELRHLRR